MPRIKKYHFARMKSLKSIRNCVGAGSLAPKSLKISPKTGTTSNDKKSRDQERDANDDDRIGHGRLDLLAQAGAGLEEAGQAVENLREQTAGFTGFHHADKKTIEDTRMFRYRFVERCRLPAPVR